MIFRAIIFSYNYSNHFKLYIYTLLVHEIPYANLTYVRKEWQTYNGNCNVKKITTAHVVIFELKYLQISQLPEILKTTFKNETGIYIHTYA